jgi:hypothetical protein
MPEFSSMPYAERLSYLRNYDFLENCAENEIDPKEVLGLLTLTRAEKCVQPVVLARSPYDPITGLGNPDDMERITIACMSSNADKCPSCAEFMKRLRVRQLLNTLLVEGTQAALFTTTAPSFGKVHRSNWSKKDVFANRSKSPAEVAAVRVVKQKSRGACPCGKNHTWEEGIVGTPIDPEKYNYVKEIIWTANLPLLTKSLVRQIKYAAKKLGIDKKDLRIGAPYERQLRGALHLHALVAVDNNPAGFSKLVKQIESSWVSPTAKIPKQVFEWYLNDDAETRLKEMGINNPQPIPVSIPFAAWKKGELAPATKFGTVYDIRVLTSAEVDEESGAITNNKQAANYVAKYLGDNQGAFSPEALGRIPKQLAAHYLKLRKTALALCLDSQVLYNRISTLKTVIENMPRKLTLSKTEKGDPTTPAQYKFFVSELDKLTKSEIEPNLLVSAVLPLLAEGNLSSTDLMEILKDDPDRQQLVSLRGIKTRFNRVGSNGGFTGSLMVVSNWRDSIASLRRGMYAHYLLLSGDTPLDPSVWVHKLDLEAMELERLRRSPEQYASHETDGE